MVWSVLIVCLTVVMCTALVCETVKSVCRDRNDVERSAPKSLADFIGGGN